MNGCFFFYFSLVLISVPIIIHANNRFLTAFALLWGILFLFYLSRR